MNEDEVPGWNVSGLTRDSASQSNVGFVFYGNILYYILY